MTNEKPQVGIGVMIFKEGRVLMALRKGAHGDGEYAFPGGHLEYGESFETCARREVMEECGIEIENLRFLFVANVLAYMPQHFVHLTLTADWKNGEPAIKEPDRSGPWAWYALDALPEPLFELCRLSFDNVRSGQIYVDS